MDPAEFWQEQNRHEIEKESRVFFATGSWEEEQQMDTRMRNSKLLKCHFLGKQMFLDDGFRTGIWQNYIWSSKVSNENVGCMPLKVYHSCQWRTILPLQLRELIMPISKLKKTA